MKLYPLNIDVAEKVAALMCPDATPEVMDNGAKARNIAITKINGAYFDGIRGKAFVGLPKLSSSVKPSVKEYFKALSDLMEDAYNTGRCEYASKHVLKEAENQ